jgi:hypothetical protein
MCHNLHAPTFHPCPTTASTAGLGLGNELVADGFGDVLRLNLNRRHLDRDQLKDIAVDLRRRAWSYRRIGNTLGVDESTVRDWIPKEDSGAGIPAPEQPERVIGADGKSHPAHKPRAQKSAVATSERQEKQAHAAMAALVVRLHHLSNQSVLLARMANPTPRPNRGER